MESDVVIVTPSTTPTYRQLIAGLSKQVWPEFMLHDQVVDRYWDQLFEYFPDYQFAFIEERTNLVVGMANSIPLIWERSLDKLPEEGWDWALEKGVTGFRVGHRANLVSALQISISPSFQGKGWSTRFLDHMRKLTEIKGYNRLIAPVRPTSKQKYPLTNIDSYISWKIQDELPFDPWLRAHAKKGAEIIKSCKASMTITGSISDWKEWTGLHFYENGQYIISGALVPVNINIDKNIGMYIEPNVWMVHKLS
jgi:GNAT superfamily N-acetyltransferase